MLPGSLLVSACVDLSVRLGRLARVLGLIALASTPAAAAGPTVGLQTTPGSGCWARWGAVTTYTDGSPILLPVAYAVYVWQGHAPPATPTVTTPQTDLVRGVCVNLIPGQQANLHVTAIEGTAESAPTAPFPFIPDAPRPPTGVGLR